MPVAALIDNSLRAYRCECVIATAETEHTPTAGCTESHRRSSGRHAGTADTVAGPSDTRCTALSPTQSGNFVWTLAGGCRALEGNCRRTPTARAS
jgi:hypothetical protein